MFSIKHGAHSELINLSRREAIHRDAPPSETASVPDLREYPNAAPHHALIQGTASDAKEPVVLPMSSRSGGPARPFKTAVGVIAACIASSLAYAGGAPGTSAAVELLKGRTAADANWIVIGSAFAACVALPYIVNGLHKMSTNLRRKWSS